MNDNKTSQSAREYDANVTKTLPKYQLFHEETINLIKTYNPNIKSWIDTGGGTGNLIVKAQSCFNNVLFAVADPSKAMLDIAKNKLLNQNILYIQKGSEQIFFVEKFDVVTAIMAHHYLDVKNRIQATRNCFNMLKNGGIYITFETIRPQTDQGTEIGLQRWKNAQIMNGKSSDSVHNYMKRYDVTLHPISIKSHLQLLENVGFSTVEILWVSGMQAGFYGIKNC